MSSAAAAILEGMPDPRDLHHFSADGESLIFAGSVLLFRYRDDDAAARNVAVAALRQLGYSGQAVAAATGLTVNYVATLHQRVLREGTGGLVRPRGRPCTAEPGAWERAREWRAAGARDAEIARRLGVSQSTVLRHLGPASVQDELPRQPEHEPRQQPAPGREAGGPPAPGPEHEPAPQPDPEPAPARGSGPGPARRYEQEQEPRDERARAGGAGHGGTAGAGGRPSGGRVVFSRYAGAMLLHAFGGGAGEILAAAAGEDLAGAGLLSAVSMCFALGAATIEQFKHLAAADAGPLAGLPVLPDLRTLRPRLAAIADRTDPLALQRLFASAMLAAESRGLWRLLRR